MGSGATAQSTFLRQHSLSSRLALLRAAIFSAALIVGALSLPLPAHAWGCEGHQVVALLAEMHLTPHALEMAKRVLVEGPIDPKLNRYCKQGGTDPLADASTWPDDIRGQRPDTAPWHYVDIPLGTKSRKVGKFCDPKESCVTRAILDQLAVLRAPDSDAQKRGDALRFLIHFVGDLHQPMHAATNNDEGGNCVPVSFFGTSPQLRNPQNESYAPNLHGVWDTNILEKATGGKTVDEMAAELNQSFGSKIAQWRKEPANVDAWAWESYQLAGKRAYGKLPVRIPAEAPQVVKTCADDNHISERMLKLNEHLSEPYETMAAPIAKRRLAQAGARLAFLLNQLWP